MSKYVNNGSFLGAKRLSLPLARSQPDDVGSCGSMPWQEFGRLLRPSKSSSNSPPSRASKNSIHAIPGQLSWQEFRVRALSESCDWSIYPVGDSLVARSRLNEPRLSVQGSRAARRRHSIILGVTRITGHQIKSRWRECRRRVCGSLTGILPAECRRVDQSNCRRTPFRETSSVLLRWCSDSDTSPSIWNSTHHVSSV